MEAASPRAVISGRTHARTHSMVSCVGRGAFVDRGELQLESWRSRRDGDVWLCRDGDVPWIFERRPERPARPLPVVLEIHRAPEQRDAGNPHLSPRRCRRPEPTIGGHTYNNSSMLSRLGTSSLQYGTVGTGRQLRRLQSTARMNASEAIKSTVREAVPPQAAPPSAFQRVKGIVWSTEGIVVASVCAGMYFAYFVSGWSPSGRQMPNSAHYEYKLAGQWEPSDGAPTPTVSSSSTEEKKITRKDTADLGSFKAKTDAVFKDFKP